MSSFWYNAALVRILLLILVGYSLGLVRPSMAAVVSDVPSECLQALLINSHFFADSLEDDKIAVWESYKNDPAPRLHPEFNLSLLWRTRPLNWVVAHPEDPARTFKPTLYELALAEIRSGDSVRYDEEVFELGRYSGRGNSTHVYALAKSIDEKKAAIRMPSISRMFGFGPYLGMYTTAEARQTARDSVKNFVALEPKIRVPHVKVLRHDRLHRYAIVEFVNGNVSGRKILQTVLQTAYLDENLPRHFRRDPSVKPAIKDHNVLQPGANLFPMRSEVHDAMSRWDLHLQDLAFVVTQEGDHFVFTQLPPETTLSRDLVSLTQSKCVEEYLVTGKICKGKGYP